jgi:hypothetical protein
MNYRDKLINLQNKLLLFELESILQVQESPVPIILTINNNVNKTYLERKKKLFFLLN